MSFNNMRIMIERAGSGETSDVITSIHEFKSCLNQIIKCARDYYTDKESFIRKQADLIEKRSDGIITAMSLKWADHEKVAKEMQLQEQLKREKELEKGMQQRPKLKKNPKLKQRKSEV
eukprot:409344_1